MTVSGSWRVRAAVSIIACSGLLAAACVAEAAVSSTEAKCGKLLGKGVSKLSKTVTKELSSCRAADISGKAAGACPNAGNQAKIAAAADKLVASAESSCKSVCSVSPSVECIADALCPPKVTVSSGFPEQCSAAGVSYFNMSSLGFPGAFCESELARQLTTPADIGECASELAADSSAAVIDAIYGSITNTSNISSAAQGCLSAISKGSLKLSTTIVKGVSKCRNSILGGASGDPAVCLTSDQKLVSKVAKMETKLDGLMDDACTNTTILELDLCGNGVGQTPSLGDAKACIKAAVREISDSNTPPSLRNHGPISIIDAAYPGRARCGDNVVNQLPNAQVLIGEECDGTDDAKCPGACLPPGDAFECTCGDRARMRLFASHLLTDADAGWTGISHQQGVADLSGYVTELSECDCDAFDGPTCTGNSTDRVCTVSGFQKPSCSWDLFSGTTCDARNPVQNNIDTDSDCAVCDNWSANAGSFCKDERDCDAQCYDSAGTPSGSCDSQADCGGGEVCRGQCDKGQTCVIIPNGAPLPVAAAGATVCAVQRFRSDVTGTRNLITGEHEYEWHLFSVTHLGEASTRPCPVCGGFCVGGTMNLEICEGRCSTTTATSCRFDTDCPSGERCSSAASPDCPGGFCQLDSVCGAVETNPVANQPCYVEYRHPVFGTMSNDCVPEIGRNITGQGFKIDYEPGSTYETELPSIYPCTASGYENYLCPCPGGAGEPTKPNSCAPACDAAGPDFGVGCGTGNNNSGVGSTCAGGSKAGKLCRVPGDCPDGGTCTNPKHCVGDPGLERVACNTNGDCGVGTCQDACPSGRCVPLCVVENPSDPYEGVCAAGPPRRVCENPRFKYIECPLAAALSSACSATCSGNGDPCDSINDCPTGQTCNGPCLKTQECEAGDNGILGDGDDHVGAGRCIPMERSCYLDPLKGTGGSTLTGDADPENDYTTGMFCYTATLSAGVNAISGFPGPGRVRQKGLNITNGFASIP